ncbi:MAG: ClbS/DfsB family four-helix bundle protein [Tessaracoccus sp.]
MARPKSKAELLEAAGKQYKKLLTSLDAMSEAERAAEFTFDPEFQGKEAHWIRDRNLRDVLTHLYEWHQLLLTWVAANQTGENKPFLPPPYNWKTYGKMNVELRRKHQETSYDDAAQLVQASHAQVMELIDNLTDAELFEKGHFPWTGATTLGAYCVSATSSHYDWAMKKARVHLKTLRSAG